MVNQQENLNTEISKRPENIFRRSQFFLYLLLGIVGLISIVFLTSAIYTNRNNLLILASAFTLTSIIGILAVTKAWSASDSVKLLMFSIVLEISIAFSSAILPIYSGFPYAVLAIAIAFSITANLKTSANSEWIILSGLLGVVGSIP